MPYIQVCRNILSQLIYLDWQRCGCEMFARCVYLLAITITIRHTWSPLSCDLRNSQCYTRHVIVGAIWYTLRTRHAQVLQLRLRKVWVLETIIIFCHDHVDQQRLVRTWSFVVHVLDVRRHTREVLLEVVMFVPVPTLRGATSLISCRAFLDGDWRFCSLCRS